MGETGPVGVMLCVLFFLSFLLYPHVKMKGTSNWSGDYFVSTGGVSLTINQTQSSSLHSNVQIQLREVFERDWFSQYTTPAEHCLPNLVR